MQQSILHYVFALSVAAVLTTAPRARAQSCSMSTPCVSADNSSNGPAVQGYSSGGIGVVGITDDSTFTAPTLSYGGYFISGSLGSGVHGQNTDGGAGVEGVGYPGVYGSTVGTSSISYAIQAECLEGGSCTAVYALGGSIGVSGAGSTHGIYGSSSSGTGVYGISSSGWGVVGTLGNAPSGTAGVYGDGGSNDGVYGTSTGYGVVGNSSSSTKSGVAGYDTSSGNGVYASSSSGYGVYGVTGGGNVAGVYGTSTGTTGNGVYGYASNGWDGVVGESASAGGYGVQGINTDGGLGVQGESTSAGGTGVYGTGAAYGVYGTASSGDGVYGMASSGDGVYGTASSGDGVYGTASSSSWVGVFGTNTSGGGAGVAGYLSGTGNAVQGSNSNTSGFAGYFSGNLQVTGTPYCSGCTAFTNNSDSRLKKNIQSLQGAMDQLLKLRGVTFEWVDPAEHGNHQGMQRGFIAQEVEKVLPEWVGVDAKGFKTLSMTGIEPMLVESIRTLKAENAGLRARVDALEANRRPLISGLTAEGGLFGLGFVTMGAFVVSRRKRSESQGQGSKF
jgi:hypothetical protein